MSDSRLEKFIYAICSMDVTDLPVPLSRIEKLWNCLITGETPDFEPLSRNEKYLMAMLDRYDISNLPAPMSRGEKLLYKIAVGETDLSDVPGYLSRYEELLKYLIENGGISGGDFEYVLYTLNQSLSTLYSTTEKPIKSAILKGQTIINLVNNFTFGTGVTETDDYFTLTQTNTTENIRVNIENSLIELNKDYTFIYFIQEKTTNETSLVIKQASYLAPSGNVTITQNIGWNKIKFNVSSFGSNRGLNIAIAMSEQDGNYIKFAKNKFALLAGDWTNKNIPFNTVKYGMQSVKMPVLTTTGKNLFNGNIIENSVTKIEVIENIECISTLPMNNLKSIVEFEHPIKLDDGVIISFVVKVDGYLKIKPIFEDDTFGSEIGTWNQVNPWTKLSFIVPSNSKKIKGFTCIASSSGLRAYIQKETVQIEQGTKATSYEPYKTNILSTPEDLVLGKVGNVKDTIDLITGEYVQRIGEYIITGDENWSMNTQDNCQRFSFYSTNIHNIRYNEFDSFRTYITCDKLKGVYWSNSWNTINTITINNGSIYIHLPLGTTMEQAKAMMIGTKIQYQLATESVKTVDLTIQDQDNQPTRLGTFENITHVSLESAGLIPEVEMEVATRISKELASASPLMDDISIKQEQLNTTVDEQSNNVDATMIATTEIYEETL